MRADAMQGKSCLVTGATAGIGLRTAAGLAAMGAHVILVGRNEQKVARVAADLKTRGADRIDSHVADLSRHADVRRLAQEVEERYERLDVLVNNVGALYRRRQESVDGIELTFALNHLAPYLLTNLLLDCLRANGPARIVTVSSAAHKGQTLEFDDLECKKKYNWRQAYGRSKLANVMFTYELARRIEGTGVTANALHPGFVASKFGHNNGLFIKSLIRFSQLFAISEEKGARTSLYLAGSPDVEGESGKYYAECAAAHSSSVSRDEQAQRRLWDISAEMVGLEHFPARLNQFDGGK